MEHKIILPKQGLQMEEGFITQWLIQEGQTVKEGEPLFEMETDKLTITIDSSATGTLLKILHPAGDMVPVTTVIAIVGEPEENISQFLGTDERVLASPRARIRAEEKGIAIETIMGSGPDGLVIERDVLNAKATAAPDTTVTSETKQLETRIPLKGMRKIIAQRMKASLDTMAQANHRMEVDMSEAVRLREQLKELNVKINYNDIIIYCVAKALTEFPAINVSMTETEIIQKHYVNIGMAVDTDKGLLVPVIRNADKLSLTEIVEKTRDLGNRAKDSGLNPDELIDGTFTVTNLGMFGVDSFTAIINAPEAGILAVGQIKKKPTVLSDDSIAVRPMMWLSLTYDHRIVDGAPAAEFLKRVKTLLESSNQR